MGDVGCGICQHPFHPGFGCIALVCGHIFHKKCFLVHNQLHGTCAVCGALHEMHMDLDLMIVPNGIRADAHMMTQRLRFLEGELAKQKQIWTHEVTQKNLVIRHLEIKLGESKASKKENIEKTQLIGDLKIKLDHEKVQVKRLLGKLKEREESQKVDTEEIKSLEELTKEKAEKIKLFKRQLSEKEKLLEDLQEKENAATKELKAFKEHVEILVEENSQQRNQIKFLQNQIVAKDKELTLRIKKLKLDVETMESKLSEKQEENQNETAEKGPDPESADDIKTLKQNLEETITQLRAFELLADCTDSIELLGLTSDMKNLSISGDEETERDPFDFHILSLEHFKSV